MSWLIIGLLLHVLYKKEEKPLYKVVYLSMSIVAFMVQVVDCFSK